MRSAIFLFLMLLPAGCVSLSGGPCSPEEWRVAGIEDGAEGAPFDPPSERRAACEKKVRGGVSGVEDYLAGWRAGHDSYCTPESGFALGARGEAYREVCDGVTAEAFLTAYEKGKRLFDLQASEIRADQAISRAHARLWDIRRRISEIESITMSTALTHEERVDLAEEQKSLRLESQRTEASLADLTQRKVRAAAALAAYRSALATENGALRPSNASY